MQGTELSSGRGRREGQQTDSGVRAAACQCLSQPRPWRQAARAEQWGSLLLLSLHLEPLSPSWGCRDSLRNKWARFFLLSAQDGPSCSISRGLTALLRAAAWMSQKQKDAQRVPVSPLNVFSLHSCNLSMGHGTHHVTSFHHPPFVFSHVDLSGLTIW